MSTSHRMLAAFALLMLGACDPAFIVTGQVRSLPDTCSKVEGNIYAASAPIEGASVRLKCPDRTQDLATSDANGRFEYIRAGYVPRTCALVIEKPGFDAQTFSLDDLCRPLPGGPDQCTQVSLQAELTRTSGAGP